MDLELIKREIGARIKFYRAQHNLTQERFCEMIELEQSGLSNIENAKTYPHFITICSLIERGNIEPNYLFGFLAKEPKKARLIEDEIITNLYGLPQNTKELILALIKEIKNKM